MRRWKGWVAAACAALFACGGPEVQGVEARVVAETERIDFGALLLGGSATRAAVVRNQGTGSTNVEVEVEAPFSVEPAAFTLPGGQTRHLSFTFAPEELGTREAVATLRWAEQAVEIALVGEAVEGQVCPPAGPCSTVHFEPGSGCVETWVEDGTPCDDACLEGATCSSGRCVGVPLDCDDGDPCTVDTCEAGIGCRNEVDPERICGEPEDPCLVPSCGPDGGCVFLHVEDGVACGPATCDSSFVCRAGVCTELETPEGGVCGEATPCREQGRCFEGDCVQPPPSRLPLHWAESPPPGWDLRFAGLTDAQGRLIWVECAADRCVLAAASPRAGGATLRTSLFEGQEVAADGRTMLVGQVVLSSHRQGWIEGFRAGDGVRLWGVELADLLPSQAERWHVVELGAHGDRAFALVEAWEEDRLHGGWVLALDAGTGEVAWSRSEAAAFDGLVVDELGRMVFTVVHDHAAPTPGALVCLSSAGVERWRYPADASGPLAAANGQLLDGAGNIRRIDDGQIEHALHARIPLHTKSAILRFERGAIFGYPLEPCGPDGLELCPVWVPHLFSFDPWEGEIHQLLPVESAEAWDRTEPVFTEEGGFLWAESGESPHRGCERRFRLREIPMEDEEAPGFVCELPGASQGYRGATSLLEGMWAVANHCEHRLEVYDIGKERTTASRGWSTARGSPGRTGAPR